ncbi:flagellar type III secretion system pore protein FliP [Geotoga petraea]|jgi:flagellar biosynthetic protein FliP|uniref:Flagellar biosynthetic protein FliP n=1 Tax=Geotoga petraea TaxID=28234 RepID=A0A1G6K331_9BACT|nr:flagellar type III secretion system pore protein FliP [Geotoga petraea]TGG88406.1 flagellar type III secretion system pore protein FliP [Geotoga petraea]SDC25343.1 flagellar biosynthetic protein FliP [Geotoga petraea]
MKNKVLRIILIIIVLLISVSSFTQTTPGLPDVTISIEGDATNSLTPTLEIILIITVISLAPGFLMLLTSFTRIVVVLGFLRQALGTRQAPPNQVLLALALFLTVMIMFPVFTNVYDNAIVPYNDGEIGYEEALNEGWNQFKEFMTSEIIAHKNQDDVFMLANYLEQPVEDINDTPFQILVPAFALSELEIAFKMGVLIYIPFILVDMVVASILLSMGMMMIPPVLISLPFKIMLFVIVNGWDLLIGSLIRSFRGV